MNWWEKLKIKARINEPLSKHTTFKVGGRVKLFIEPKDVSELREVLILARKRALKIRILGAGSNILAADEGLDFIVISLNTGEFKKITVSNNKVIAGCGVSLGQLLQQARLNGLSGGEFLAGIPGAVGGSVMMNAGAFGRQMSDLVERLEVMDYNGHTGYLEKEDLCFAYRDSGLRKRIILKAFLKFKKSDPAAIGKKIKEHLRARCEKLEWEKPSAGCVFKNPPGKSAGQLIDLCGLKGKMIGRAGISEKHANFIINLGGAKSEDILDLIRAAKKAVNIKFKIKLEPEIKIWH